MKWFTFFLLLSNTLTSFAFEIALTFDDAPRGNGNYYTGIERTNLLITKLKIANVQAAFFCNPGYWNPEARERIKSYSDAHHIIANHTNSHPDLDLVGPQEFIAEIELAHKRLNHFNTFQRWFRFPYLHEGNTVEYRDELRSYLRGANYQNGYVTVDSFDWYLEEIFQQALRQNKKINFEKLKYFYVNIMWEEILFYDELAKRTLGRSPKHILLLHESDIAALFLSELIDKIKSKGWKIISPIEAYQDPISSVEPDIISLNQGRVASMAMERGVPGPYRSIWEDTSHIDQTFMDAAVFE